MKKRPVIDERVRDQRRKLGNEAYTILIFALMLSLIVQQLVFGADFEQVAGEFFCFFGVSLYVVIRSFMIGLDMYDGAMRKRRDIRLLTAVVTAVTIMVVSGLRDYPDYISSPSPDWGGYIADLAISGVSAGVSSFLIVMLVYYLNGKRQASLEKRLDAEETAD